MVVDEATPSGTLDEIVAAAKQEQQPEGTVETDKTAVEQTD